MERGELEKEKERQLIMGMGKSEETTGQTEKAKDQTTVKRSLLSLLEEEDTEYEGNSDQAAGDETDHRNITFQLVLEGNGKEMDQGTDDEMVEHHADYDNEIESIYREELRGTIDLEGEKMRG